MKIKIEDIPSQGLHKEMSYDPQELDMEIENHPYSLPVKFSTPITAIADIMLYDKELVVEEIVLDAAVISIMALYNPAYTKVSEDNGVLFLPGCRELYLSLLYPEYYS